MCFQPKPKSSDDYGSEYCSAMGELNLNNFLQTINDMSVDGKKLRGEQPVPKPRVKSSGVAAKDDEAADEVLADPVMELVTRTLTDMVNVL